MDNRELLDLETRRYFEVTREWREAHAASGGVVCKLLDAAAEAYGELEALALHTGSAALRRAAERFMAQLPADRVE